MKCKLFLPQWGVGAHAKPASLPPGVSPSLPGTGGPSTYLGLFHSLRADSLGCPILSGLWSASESASSGLPGPPRRQQDAVRGDWHSCGPAQSQRHGRHFQGRVTCTLQSEYMVGGTMTRLLLSGWLWVVLAHRPLEGGPPVPPKVRNIGPESALYGRLDAQAPGLAGLVLPPHKD